MPGHRDNFQIDWKMFMKLGMNVIPLEATSNFYPLISCQRGCCANFWCETSTSFT